MTQEVQTKEMTAAGPVILEVSNGIATLTIDRPAQLNALNLNVIEALERALGVIASNEEVRGVIVTGSGGRSFVAGADIKAMSAYTPREAHEFSTRGSQVMQTIEELPVPVIAAVDGFALGGGCELALACDFIVASPKSTFGQPEVNLGLIAGFGGTQRLPRKVPYGIAMELLVTGRMVKADEALRIGLINRIVESEHLLTACRAIIAKVAAAAPLAVAATKRLVRSTSETSQSHGLSAESEAFGGLFGTEDAHAGMNAFVAKEPTPRYRGR